MEAPDERRALAALRAYGWNATSFQTLEPGFAYFPWEDGVVAYVDTGGAWVAAGAPIVAETKIPDAARAFAEAAKQAKRRAVFFAVEDRFLATLPIRSMMVGEQPVWDASRWPETLRGSKSLREQIRRARAKGVVVRRIPPDEIAEPSSGTRKGVEALVKRWIASRPMARMGFLVELWPFSLPEERRYFVAERAGETVGFLAVVPVYAREGWFFEDLLRDPHAPNGTAEILVDGAMKALSAEGARYVTLGLAPLAGDLPTWLRVARRLGAPLYDFAGLRAFKGKLRPEAWDRIHVAWTGGPAFVAVYDVLVAFSRGGLLRFGVQTLFRVPNIVVQTLAVLLVPWTIALAAAKGSVWFPSRVVQVAWVAFDVLLFFGLWSLASRWRRRLATALAAAVTLDAILTTVEAAIYNATRAHTALERSVVLTAVLAPTIAAIALWRARFLRSRWARH